MIVFRNKGAIDLRALTTFGLSSKAGQDKIGRFGTGLKYATAVIVRNGGKVSFFNGDGWKVTGTREDMFRDQAVMQITFDDADLPFTTDLGRDWEVWMAFRELYSNALDEEGTVSRTDDLPDSDSDETIIAVDLDAFEAIYFSMEEHFIGADEEPVYATDSFEVYRGRSQFVFYRGIAIQKLKYPAAYRYNLKGYVDLTEDRTAKYNWQVQNRIASGILLCTNTDIATAACDQRNEYEASIDFSDVGDKPCEVFLGAAVSLAANCNPTATAIVRAQLPSDGSTATILQKGAPGAEKLSESLGLLRNIGADLSKAKFVLAEGIPIYRDFDVRGDAVFISEDIFEKQDRMNLAVVEGYSGVIGGNWMARQLIAKAQAPTPQAEKG